MTIFGRHGNSELLRRRLFSIENRKNLELNGKMMIWKMVKWENFRMKESNSAQNSLTLYTIFGEILWWRSIDGPKFSNLAKIVFRFSCFQFLCSIKAKIQILNWVPILIGCQVCYNLIIRVLEVDTGEHEWASEKALEIRCWWLRSPYWAGSVVFATQTADAPPDNESYL